MRHGVVFLLLLSAVSFPSDCVAEPPPIDRLAAELDARVVAWRRDIHQHPELGNREFRTAALVAEHLRGLGLEVQTGVAHTGVVGLLRGGKPGPVVALRADMDGLPVTEASGLPFASVQRAEYNGQQVGVMHACGHDTHVAILMGVAEVLAAVRDSLPGSVKFIFQPAEEGPPAGEEGGAKLMVEQGVLESPSVDAVFGLHISSGGPVGHIGYRPGGAMASAEDFRILVKGRQAHGAYPWSGTDPVLAAAHIVTALQSIVSRDVELTDSAAVVTVGSIHGGVRSNIIPAEVELIGTLRALTPANRDLLRERLRAIATSVGSGLGATVEVTVPLGMSYPVTFNDHDLTRQMLPTLQRVAGPEQVRLESAVTGAEDFSFFADKVPGFYFFLGGRSASIPEDQAPGHHTPEFMVDDSALGLGVRAMSWLAWDYLAQAPTAGSN